MKCALQLEGCRNFEVHQCLYLDEVTDEATWWNICIDCCDDLFELGKR